MIRACRDLIPGGRVALVALSLGANGALLVSGDEALRAWALAIRPGSTIGAGDSFLGAMVSALVAGRPLPDAFRWAVADGSAALLAPGAQLCLAADVRRLADAVTIEVVSG
jgi:6-phosphofructokinase 2